ncbi:Gfo/Idh/MocA family protein [uncultured Amnibacterium sp.]|uniref:Gfo/Idh/MocA family protein n=1 Tax=uncultured Amnibacterium sp. TaxID=1631851 RepID=UPI0035C9E9BB
MTTSSLGWGILGTGLIATLFTADLQAVGLRVAAVGSRTVDRAQAFAAEHEIPAAHGSWQELVDDPSVDVVYVATPHPAHVAAALMALEAGKHVLVEKAFTMTAVEAEAIVRLAEERGLVALEAMWTRFLPHMLEIHAAIEAGEIGDPQVLIAEHCQALPTDPAHRLNAPELGGGALLDLGVYPISFAVDLFGPPEQIDARAVFTETGVDGRVSGTLVHAGGRHSLFTAALNIPGVNGATILGTGGSIVIDPTWYTATGYTVRDRDQQVVRRSQPAVSGRGMQFQAFELERLVREGRIAGDRMPPAQSVQIMAVLDAIRDTIGLRYPGEGGPTGR